MIIARRTLGIVHIPPRFYSDKPADEAFRPHRPANNAAPDPPDGSAAITAITKLSGPFAQRCTP